MVERYHKKERIDYEKDSCMCSDRRSAGSIDDWKYRHAWQRKQKTFTVGFDAEYPPFGYMDEDGEYTGFDLELAQAVCDLQGWELVKTPIDWDSKDMELNSGAIDCIWNGFTMNGREEDYTWSVAVRGQQPGNRYSGEILISTDLAGLAGKTVGVQAASAALELLSDGGDQADLAATFGTLQQFPDYNNAFIELQAGSIDAISNGYRSCKLSAEAARGLQDS